MGKLVIFRANQVLHLLIYRFGVRFCGKIGYISCETTNSFAFMHIWDVFFGKATGLRESLGTSLLLIAGRSSKLKFRTKFGKLKFLKKFHKKREC